MANDGAPTPKYQQVLNTLRERISDGTYGPGSALPSEHQLVDEFDASRTSVLKALSILRTEGWIESFQGKGRFVRARPPSGTALPAYAAGALDVDETVHAEVLDVSTTLVSPRIGEVLNLPDGTPVYVRRRRTVSDLGGPLDLVTTFVPVQLAIRTGITQPGPIGEGLLEHIEKHKNIRADYAREWLTAIPANTEEARLLDVPEGAALLSIVIGVYDATGEPILASLVLMPGSRHEIEDTYPVR